MKKYVLSAVVTGLLVPAVYAMDEGAAPAVEIETPAVEVTVEDVATEEVVIEEVVAVETELEVTALEVVDDEVKLEVGVEVEDSDLVRRDAVEVQSEVVECFEGEAVDENGEPVVCYTLGGAEGELYLMTAGPVEGGEVVDGGTVDGEAVDPNLYDLATQSGVAVGGEEGAAAEELTVTHVETTEEDPTPIRALSAGGIQPNFRGGDAEIAANHASADSSDAEADAQLLNDEQRGAVRGLRGDSEPAKSRTGLVKFISKFRKPKSDVTLASATSSDKGLAAKLAEVDRMRDTALRTGDKKMLAKADKLEKELRAKSGKVTRIPTRTKTK